MYCSKIGTGRGIHAKLQDLNYFPRGISTHTADTVVQFVVQFDDSQGRAKMTEYKIKRAAPNRNYKVAKFPQITASGLHARELIRHKILTLFKVSCA